MPIKNLQKMQKFCIAETWNQKICRNLQKKNSTLFHISTHHLYAYLLLLKQEGTAFLGTNFIQMIKCFNFLMPIKNLQKMENFNVKKIIITILTVVVCILTVVWLHSWIIVGTILADGERNHSSSEDNSDPNKAYDSVHLGSVAKI